ncbi:MAG: 2-amino-4-hydroxy-6-hydroxymethyldihydropteridine diphosphokinase [Candidatus Aureabacteria bacterium]|nr:2-amino-4-hydroxy-6-hydroxymethyldihydropteridine diphosphokinase [Candidatus Auribacterota bacterium]
MGGNRGDREGLLSRACGMIRERIGDLARVSSMYESEPWGFEDPTSFYNLAAEVKTALSPEVVLRKIHEIEDSLGRIRALPAARRASDGERIYEPRAMDIDILFYGSKMIRTKDLAIPHPRLAERKFILVPLAEIAPELVHPGLNKTIGELLAACRDTGNIKRRGGIKEFRGPQGGCPTTSENACFR